MHAQERLTAAPSAAPASVLPPPLPPAVAVCAGWPPAIAQSSDSSGWLVWAAKLPAGPTTGSHQCGLCAARSRALASLFFLAGQRPLRTMRRVLPRFGGMSTRAPSELASTIITRPSGPASV
jgi:hypothetical protein